MEIEMKTSHALIALALASATLAAPASAGNNKSFALKAAQTTCLLTARGRVTVAPHGAFDNMHVEVWNLPANKTFTLFVIQVPKAPFGMAWYQGDVVTDAAGVGVGDFVGLFDDETFSVAPGVAPAPKIHPTDATVNPATAPLHQYHLGMWFDSKADAVAAGCPNVTTPFNGDHTAGVQVLNTSLFPDNAGPLRFVN
jgi:hypothetical protein